jgi:hypothetical protein
LQKLNFQLGQLMSNQSLGDYGRYKEMISKEATQVTEVCNQHYTVLEELTSISFPSTVVCSYLHVGNSHAIYRLLLFYVWTSSLPTDIFTRVSHPVTNTFHSSLSSHKHSSCIYAHSFHALLCSYVGPHIVSPIVLYLISLCFAHTKKSYYHAYIIC